MWLPSMDRAQHQQRAASSAEGCSLLSTRIVHTCVLLLHVRLGVRPRLLSPSSPSTSPCRAGWARRVVAMIGRPGSWKAASISRRACTLHASVHKRHHSAPESVSIMEVAVRAGVRCTIPGEKRTQARQRMTSALTLLCTTRRDAEIGAKLYRPAACADVIR